MSPAPMPHRPFRRAVLAAACAAALALPAGARAAGEAAQTGWSETLKAAARLIDGGTVDGKRVAGLEIRLDPGAVTYWRSPGEAGVPPTIGSAGSDNLASLETLFPAPEPMDKGGALTFGYARDVILPLVVAPRDRGKPVRLVLSIDYGVCEKICVPAHADLALTLPAGAGPAGHSARLAAALAATPRPRPLGAEGAPSILTATRAPGAAPVWRVVTRGAAPTLFVEAPDGWWFDVSGPQPGGPGEAIFTLERAQAPDGASADPDLRLTLTTREGAIETTLRLDPAAPKP